MINMENLASFGMTCVLACSACYRLLESLLSFLWLMLSRQTAAQRSKATPIRISSPNHRMKPSYDVVVIGSGYGGGVAASRMARGQPKQSVCVLERGLERWPGEYPESLWDVLRQVRVTGHISFGPIKDLYIRVGRVTGLYHWIIGKGSNAFVANGKLVSLDFKDSGTNIPKGLGGTSLVNANVFLRPDPRVLKSPEFPSQLRQHDVLDPCTFLERVDVSCMLLMQAQIPSVQWPCLSPRNAQRCSQRMMYSTNKRFTSD